MITVQELELISYCLINTVSLGLLTWSQVPLNGQSFQVNPSWCLTRWREGTEDSSNKAGIVSSRLQKDVSAWPVRRKWGKEAGVAWKLRQAKSQFGWSNKESRECSPQEGPRSETFTWPMCACRIWAGLCSKPCKTRTPPPLYQRLVISCIKMCPFFFPFNSILILLPTISFHCASLL